MRLADTCTIQMGYSARERLVETPIGVPAIQLSDLTQSEDVVDMEPTSVNLDRDKVKNRYFAGGGDVLFRSRGRNTTAAHLPDNWPYLSVIVMPLLILKPDNSRIRPEYLTWAINSQEAQNYFEKNEQGQRMPMISRAVLENLPIPEASLQQQSNIVEVSRLSKQAYELENRLAFLRKHISHLKITQALDTNYSKGAGT